MQEGCPLASAEGLLGNINARLTKEIACAEATRIRIFLSTACDSVSGSDGDQALRVFNEQSPKVSLLRLLLALLRMQPEISKHP